jgi:tetratricopeptide (TPR) repeat protein
MARLSELTEQLQVLIQAQLWPQAVLHLRHAAEHVRSRGEAQVLRQLLDHFPPAARQDAGWPRALAWVAYRSFDAARLREALATSPQPLPAFEAWQAALDRRWADVFPWAVQALAGPHPGEAILAARFRAEAMAALQQPGWPAAYREAAARATGRDRGLICSELAHYLSSNNQEAAARDAYAQAIPELRQDAWWLALTQANLGITCLRLGLLPEAERALNAAAQSAQHPEGRAQLSTVWRGLGGLALHRGQHARAHHAFEMALQKAETAPDRLAARRGSARVSRMEGRHDEAMTQLHEGLRADAPDAVTHSLYADLAALHLLIGDPEGAARRLTEAQTVTAGDDWRVRVVRAELARQTGQAISLTELQAVAMDQTWAQEEARVFPALFGLLGRQSARPAWTARVCADGPVSLVMSGAAVPLAPERASASLLAFLMNCGGAATTERLLDALDLPGTDLRARKKALSKVVNELRQILGWPGAVLSRDGLVELSRDVHWAPLELPGGHRIDLFCEGRADPWVTEWRSEHLLLNFGEPV